MMFYRLDQDVDSLRVGAGALGGFLGWVYPDVFGLLFLVLIVANAIDWYWGRRVALYANRYDRARSRAGIHSKAGTLMILLLLRTLESILPVVGLPDVMGIGIGGSMIALMLVADELESIEDHVVALGGRRIPLFGTVLAKLRSATGGSRRVKGEGNPPGAPPRGEEESGPRTYPGAP
jgi:hypothetical protein